MLSMLAMSKCMLKNPTPSWAGMALSVLVLAAQADLYAAPPGRLINWNPGIPGGVPNRTTIYTTIPAGASVSSIQSALNACPANQVVQLSAGTYNFSGTIYIPSYVTLRGAGPGKTILSL